MNLMSRICVFMGPSMQVVDLNMNYQGVAEWGRKTKHFRMLLFFFC